MDGIIIKQEPEDDPMTVPVSMDALTEDNLAQLVKREPESFRIAAPPPESLAGDRLGEMEDAEDIVGMEGVEEEVVEEAVAAGIKDEDTDDRMSIATAATVGRRSASGSPVPQQQQQQQHQQAQAAPAPVVPAPALALVPLLQNLAIAPAQSPRSGVMVGSKYHRPSGGKYHPTPQPRIVRGTTMVFPKLSGNPPGGVSSETWSLAYNAADSRVYARVNGNLTRHAGARKNGETRARGIQKMMELGQLPTGFVDSDP